MSSATVPVTVTVRYYAGARAAAGVTEETAVAATAFELRAVLTERHGPKFAQVLAASTLRTDGRPLPDDFVLAPGAVVEVLPPFAGG